MGVPKSKAAQKELMDFQERYPTRLGKIRALSKMTDEQIDRLIDGCATMQGRIICSSHKKGKKAE